MLRATRGVCIGVDRNLAAGDPVPQSVDAATLRFLVSINAVAEVEDEPAQTLSNEETDSESSKEGSADEESDSESNSAPRKRGKKEK